MYLNFGVWVWVLACRNKSQITWEMEFNLAKPLHRRKTEAFITYLGGRCWVSSAGGQMTSLFLFVCFKVHYLHFCCCTLVFQLLCSWCEPHHLLLATKSLLEVCPSFSLWGCWGCLNHKIYIKLPPSGRVWRAEVERSSDLLNLDSIAVASQLDPVTQSQEEENWPEVSEGTLGEMQLWN